MNYNLKNPAVKRILQEIKEVQADTSGDFIAEALENDIFEWHFVIRGPADSEFEGGVYHGRILLPAEYPFKPPAFMMLTPSGRFETGVKICLSISAHHPEHWQPSWSVRTALTALVAFMPSPGAGALGSLDYTKDERKKLAAKSRQDAPKWGSAERQKLIEDMHARMLAMPPSQSLATKHINAAEQAAGAPSRDPVADSEQGGAGAGQGSDAVSTAPSPQLSPVKTPSSTASPAQSPKHAPARASAAMDKAQSPEAGASYASPLLPPVETQSVTPSSVPALAHPQAPSCVKHREAGPPSAPATPTVSRHTAPPTPRTPNAVATPPAHDLPPPDTWALNAIAVALGVLILAILLRKALVAVGYEVPSITGLGAFTDGQ